MASASSKQDEPNPTPRLATREAKTGPDIHFALFLSVYGPRLHRGSKTSRKELGQYPAILTSRSVKNPLVVGYFMMHVSFFVRC